MSETALRVSSRSYADDAAYTAVVDLARACAHLAWRLVGGIAVHLQQRRHDLADVPDRPTQDADAAIQVAATPDRGRAEVDADIELLLDRLTASNYTQQGRSNRFVRQGEDERPDSVIDVLVPGYYSTIRHNRAIAGGRMLVDEVPGLGFALGAQPADIVALTVQTLDGQEVTEIVPLATVFSLLTTKAGAWSGRRSPKDALDIWRLLEMARLQALEPSDWPTGGSAGEARAALAKDLDPISIAATPVPRSQARVRALIATHVGLGDGPHQET